MTQGAFTIGIDLGGTTTRMGMFDARMDLLASRSIVTRVAAGPQACVEEMADVVRALLYEQDSSGSGDILGIGIGSPGPINLKTGVLGLLPNLPGWENFHLRDALAEATGFPVILESDANAAAIGEWKFGAGRSTGLDSMAMITLGTGVGSGLILNDRVWHGMCGMAGEIGHATIDPEGPMCGCGTRGCLELYSSANGLVRIAKSVAESSQGTSALLGLMNSGEELTTLKLAMLAEKGNDSAAQLVFQRMGRHLGQGVASLLNTLDLPMVVIGGGVAGAWRLFAPSMFEAVGQYSVVYRLTAPSQFDSCEIHRPFICPAELGASAGLLGAAALPNLSKANSRHQENVELANA
jgi:glucokinase